MDDSHQEHDPPRESMREVKRAYEETAEGLEAGLSEWPSAQGGEVFGRADTAKAVNDAMSALFKQAADHVAGLRSVAHKIDVEAGTYDGIPVERRQDSSSE